MRGSSSNKQRLDQVLVLKNKARTRSQAENLIKLGKVMVDGELITKPGTYISPSAKIRLNNNEIYVSRAAYKLQSATEKLNVRFHDKTVLDIGSSTGGFTQYTLKHDAHKVVAVDVGTDQLHPLLREDKSIALYEKTDIRDFDEPILKEVNMVLADVSFISLREIIPSLLPKLKPGTELLLMVKPQFESGDTHKHKGVIKNDKIRREILKDFEDWLKTQVVIKGKADSDVTGAKGNRERFYLCRKS